MRKTGAERRWPVPLQPGIIYGPIASKRLGRSLGINVSGTRRKLCNYNCVYCFYGSTQGEPRQEEYPSVNEIEEAVRAALQSDTPADWLTFSGNGESTTHPDFYEIVTRTRRLIDKYRPGLPLALLSNGYKITDPQVQAAIRMIDLPVLKLDAGDTDSFLKINRPIGRQIELKQMVEGLRTISLTRGLVMQTVIFDGKPSNSSGAAYAKWLEAIKYIHPEKLQLYTLDRAIGSIKPIDKTRMSQVSQGLTKSKTHVETYWEKNN